MKSSSVSAKIVFLYLLLTLGSVNQLISQELLWKFKTQDKVYSSAQIDGKLLYIGSGDGHLYALDKKTGKVAWNFKTDGKVHSTPMVTNGMVIVGSSDGLLYALDKKNGSLNWSFRSEGEKFNGPWDYYLSSPRSDDSTIYWGSGDGHMYALDVKGGSMKWKFKTEGIVHASPTLYKNLVLTGSFDGKLYALDKATGQLEWDFDTDGEAYFPKGEIQKAVTVVDDVVYFGSRDYQLYALDINNGNVLWKFKEPAGWIIATPTDKGDRLYFGVSDGHSFYCLDRKEGIVIWKKPVKMRVFGSALTHKDHVIFGTFDGKLMGLNADTGSLEFEFQTEGSKQNYHKVFKDNGSYQDGFALYGADMMKTEGMILDLGSILSTPSLDAGILYFGSADGYVYAVKLP